MSRTITIATSATTANLVALHNAFADKPVKTFKSKVVATERTIAAITVVFDSPDVTKDDIAATLDGLADDLGKLVTVKGRAPAADKTPTPRSGFTASTFTTNGVAVKARKTSTIFKQLAFILDHADLTVGEVYEAYNRADLPESASLNPTVSGDRPSDRPGWINNATFKIAVDRGLIEMVTIPADDAETAQDDDQAVAA